MDIAIFVLHVVCLFISAPMIAAILASCIGSWLLQHDLYDAWIQSTYGSLLLGGVSSVVSIVTGTTDHMMAWFLASVLASVFGQPLGAALCGDLPGVQDAFQNAALGSGFGLVCCTVIVRYALGYRVLPPGGGGHNACPGREVSVPPSRTFRVAENPDGTIHIAMVSDV